VKFTRSWIRNEVGEIRNVYIILVAESLGKRRLLFFPFFLLASLLFPSFHSYMGFFPLPLILFFYN
jgi:hypothetical protein